VAVPGKAKGVTPRAATHAERPFEPTPEVAVPAAPIAKTTDIAALVAPLAAGVVFGPWRVAHIADLDGGAASLVLSDENGELFQLDVCRRDDTPGALVPPGRSAHFDVYLSNEGYGDTASCEHHGLAAMAVADAIRRNESSFDRTRFLTLRERLSTSISSVKRRT